MSPAAGGRRQIERIWRGACTRICRLDGLEPYSTVRAEPVKRWLYHMVMVPWQTPPQSKRLAGQVELAGDLAGEPPVLGVGVDAVQRLVEAQDPAWA